MIHKLRNRIFIFSSIILIGMLVLILSGIYILMYNSEVKQSEEVMRMAMDVNSTDMFPDNQPMRPDMPRTQHPSDGKIPFPQSGGDSSGVRFGSDNKDQVLLVSDAETETETTAVRDDERRQPDKSRVDDSMLGDTILIELDKDKNISDIQYRYWGGDKEDTGFSEKAVSLVFEEKDSAGKIKVSNIKMRYMYTKSPAGYELVLLNRSTEISMLNRLLIILLIIGFVVSVVFIVLSILLANWVVKPVAYAWEKQKQFVADASHELKTPLTVINANADVILANQDDLVANQTKWLGYIKDETERMSKLVTSLLSLAKADSQINVPTVGHKKVNLSHLVSGVCLVFEPLVFESSKALDTNITPDIEFSCNEDEMKQLVTILIDNALKHSGMDAVIDVSLKRDNKKIVLEVLNTQSSIPKEHTKKIFERFYRVDESRNRNTGGSGLGLNIAKTIVLNHRGSIKVKSSDNVTVFTVTF